jgi:phage tail sheath protein FI
MPVRTTYPGVYIEELPSGVRTIAGVATSITAFIGWAPQGPTDTALKILSWGDYERTFGGLHRDSHMSYAVSHFFVNGGTEAYILRVAAPTPCARTEAINDLTLVATGPGEWANAYGVEIKPRTDPGGAGKFGLRVVHVTAPDRKPDVVEVFENLSMDRDDPRYVELVINEESQFVNAEVKGTSPPATDQDHPTMLQGGVNGEILTPGDQKFHDAILVARDNDPTTPPRGLDLLDKVDLFNLLCIPGETDKAFLSEMAAFCCKRRAFLIVDCKGETNYRQMRNSLDALPAGNDMRNAAVFFPWIKVPDPRKEGRLRAFPPCGAVAGIFARTDATRGVWKAPAGIDASLTGVTTLVEVLTDEQNGELNPQAVNCLRTFKTYGNVVWGARTLRGQDAVGDEYKYIPVRRTALYIEESLYRGLKWVVFEPNDEPLWAQIRLNVGAFMHTMFRQGAFQGSTPRDAYLVKCDRETTTQNDINLGIVNIIVGFAPLKPAEFVIVKIKQLAGQIEV